ncbi:hypothetical protein B0I35DRAFT_482981 [Stachybotrys elegans]|uniref:Uncharacterized protein n=1 Tax=Stachybotrys elegans TaxID=80388 RepID=A0A8K0SHL4_9HYPO|nr:hypothetical protein B0I35DRAFT_482981 [Stachybotrys elegans]
MFDAATPAGGKGVTSVASFDSPITIGDHLVGYYTVHGGELIEFPWEYSYPWPQRPWDLEVWPVSLYTNTTDQACSPLPDDTPNLEDYFVLFGEYDAGSDITFYVGRGNTFTASSIFRETAEIFLEILRAGHTLRITIDNLNNSPIKTFRFENHLNPGAVSTFSSWGPNFDLDLKPQFGAPGRYIDSLWFVDEGSYTYLSGTGSAVAFAAAAYALIAEARGVKPEPKLFESLFASTAKAQLYSWNAPYQNFLAPVSQQGAGLIQVYDAAFTKAYLEPSGLSFNDTANFAGPLTFTIVNMGDEATFDISYVSSQTFYSLDDDETYSPVTPGERSTETAELSFSETKVTVAAGSTATVEVTASPPEGLNAKRYPYWSGFITVNGTDGSALSIPYQGIVGSLYEANVLPYMLTYSSDDAYYTPIYDNQTFYVPEQGVEFDWQDYSVTAPVLELDLPWGAREVFIEVVPATTCTKLPTPGGYVNFNNDFVPRGYSWQNEAVWAGRLASGEYAPAGRYILVARVQRLFSEGTKDEDWVSIATPPFFIEYPY